jgi:drug/metabolite transporter (DMT)-like permease
MFAVVLWGANNTGTKFVVTSWPPLWTGGSRFVAAGLLMALLLKLFPGLGQSQPLTRALKLQIWLRGGLSLAVYITVFNFALKHTSASHVGLYLGAAPVWALLWEGRPKADRASFRRYAAALVAVSGVVVLFLPSLGGSKGSWVGELLGLAAGILWTSYGRQCRRLGKELSPVQITAHSMWQAGVLLLPLSLFELYARGLVWRWEVGAVHLYCITLGSIVTFAIWTNALRHWKTSQVLVFNNLIPLSTMAWAAVALGERITPNFWAAMVLVLGGVLLGQSAWLDGWPSRKAFQP